MKANSSSSSSSVSASVMILVVIVILILFRNPTPNATSPHNNNKNPHLTPRLSHPLLVGYVVLGLPCVILPRKASDPGDAKRPMVECSIICLVLPRGCCLMLWRLPVASAS